jgi:dTDP-4-dehydrorhamnose 3,5-epimerase
MRAVPAGLAGAMILEPEIIGDARGYLLETYNRLEFERATGVSPTFVQDLQTMSVRGVVRGVHYQLYQPQAKLVSVLVGEVFDVIVDLRRSSPTFGEWRGVTLSAQNLRQLWIPAGFGHGFCVLSAEARLFYKISDFYLPKGQRTILWNDPDLRIEWPLPEGQAPSLSPKDRDGTPLRAAEVYD